MKNYRRAIWEKTKCNVRACIDLRKILSVIILSLVIVYWYGNNSTKMSDMLIDTIAVPSLGVILWFIIYGLWSWATAPRQIYYEQSEKIDEYTKANQRQVIEIKTIDDFNFAQGLYCTMPLGEMHHPSHIKRWWKEEQAASVNDRESREIFLIAKQKQEAWSILYATCPFDNYILNIYGFAKRDLQKSDIDEWDSSQDIVKALLEIVKRDLPKCRGVLIEVDSKKIKELSPKKILFDRLAAVCDIEFQEICKISYKIPEIYYCSRNKNEEKSMTLLYARAPWGQDNLDVNNKSHIGFLVHSMYSIYTDCLPGDTEWRIYLEDLEKRIMDTYLP
jgi:hypothetical protein